MHLQLHQLTKLLHNKQEPSQTVLEGSANPDNVANHCNEHFEDLLNPIIMSKVRQNLRTQVKLSLLPWENLLKFLKSLRTDGDQGVDEIHPKMKKALDFVEILW